MLKSVLASLQGSGKFAVYFWGYYIITLPYWKRVINRARAIATGYLLQIEVSYDPSTSYVRRFLQPDLKASRISGAETDAPC